MNLPQTKYAKIDGLHIAYQLFGEGPIDVIVVPNWITHCDGQWEIPGIARALESLASFSRVIVYDQRGTGMSDPVPLDALPTLEQRVDDIVAVMDAAGSEKAALVCFSSAGTLGVVFAAMRPERTSALILANAYPRILKDDDFPWGMAQDLINAMLGTTAERWGSGKAVWGLAESADEPSLQMWARYQRQAASPGTAAAMVRFMTNIDVRRVLPEIRVPALVLVHESPTPSIVPRKRNAKYLAENIPDAKLLNIGGDAPADLNAFMGEIREFLTGVREAPEGDRVLATVLFSDIVGSTEIASRLGDRNWRDLLNRHNDVVRRQLARFRGNEVKALGDGFLATFDGPARGVRCAEAIRDAVERLDIQVRIGLHTGEVEMRDGDVGGIGVHIASRVADLAESSQVLVSRTVKDLVTGSGISFAEAGSYELKGVPGTWQLYSVTREVSVA